MSFLKKTFSILLVFIILCSIAACQQTSNVEMEPIYGTEFVLNTAATVTIYDSDNYDLIDQSFQICRDYENKFSKTIKDSEIEKLNSRQISIVSDETAELIETSLEFSAVTNGAFDISIGSITNLWDFTSEEHLVPDPNTINTAKEFVDFRKIKVNGQEVLFENENTQLDLGAIAKGYIADQMKIYLIEQGVESAIINLGGNVQCIGRKADDQGFRVGIQKPFDSGSAVILELDEEYSSVVTSGIYQRYFEKDNELFHHIIDPQTGFPSKNNLLSVSIISKDSATGDALSTACFVLGIEKSLNLIDGLEDVYAIFIDENYNIFYSSSLKEKINISQP